MTDEGFDLPPPADPHPPLGRNAHPYFLYDMIQRQPESVGRTVAHARRRARELPSLPESGRVLFVGMGTSFHAALAGASALASVGPPSLWPRAVDSFQLVTAPESLRGAALALVYSSSGETELTLRAQRALRTAEVPHILVSGAAQSRSGELAPFRLETQDAEERSFVHTVSYTTAVSATLSLIEHWTGAFREELDQLSPRLRELLARESEWRALADSVFDRPTIVLLGGGSAEATVRESALKLREGAGRFVVWLGIEEFLHGSLTTARPTTAVLAVARRPLERARARQALRAAEIAGAKTALLTADADGLSSTEHPLPAGSSAGGPVTDVLPFQLMTYWTALREQRNPDAMGYDDPRLLAARRSVGI